MVIDETGGLHGVRDRERLLSAIAQPQTAVFGRELYPTVFEKAAAYAYAILMDHPFVDGNKRTGITAALVFLEDNGWDSAAQRGDVERFALSIVRKKLPRASIAAWLKKHTRKATSA